GYTASARERQSQQQGTNEVEQVNAPVQQTAGGQGEANDGNDPADAAEGDHEPESAAQRGQTLLQGIHAGKSLVRSPLASTHDRQDERKITITGRQGRRKTQSRSKKRCPGTLQSQQML